MLTNDFLAHISNKIYYDRMYQKVPILIMLVGLPGSGKTTLANRIRDSAWSIYNIDVVIHSSDLIRKELFGDINSNDRNSDVFNELHNRIKKDLAKNKVVVYDATNINKKRRKAFINSINYINKCIHYCVCLMELKEECIKNIINRGDNGANVPAESIERFYRKWQPPYWNEGWDDIFFVCNHKHQFNQVTKSLEACYFNQGNRHHQYTLINHEVKTLEYLLNSKCLDWSKDNLDLCMAAITHDCGKIDCATEPDENGDRHYYGHESVGAYLAAFYQIELWPDVSVIEVSNLIYWHMLPYNKDAEKALKKIELAYGTDFVDKLRKLHEADINAH